MLNIIEIKIEAGAGTIWDYAEKARELAKLYNCKVTFLFNDRLVWVTSTDSNVNDYLESVGFFSKE